MKPVRHYMRALHRDLGFFAIGLTLIYALSGILLMFRGTDFLKKETTIEKTLSSDMKGQQLQEALKLRRFKVLKEDANTIVFSEGTYEKQSGLVHYTVKEYIAPFNKMVSLHKVNSGNLLHWFLVGYGIILTFLAVSALWMFKPSNKNFKRGMVLTVVGVIVSTLFLLLV
ncbi:MAG: hypothetical protein RR202_01690 [Bacteroidales bacterium]